MKRPNEYVELGCMVACYALVAAIAVMVLAPNVFLAFGMGCAP